jgi:alpha-L-fucosidase
VKNSPWKDGKGDVVGELAKSCRRYGMALGLYLSPWDRHEPTYGNQVKYNEFYRNQLRELMTNYGELAEVWFDGAKGPNAKDMEYDWNSYYTIVRERQPKAVIFQGPDVRWVGNEAGYARESEWSVVNRHPRPFAFVDAQKRDLGSLEALGDGNRLVWYPAETDVSIRPGWFYHATQDNKVKSLKTLLDIFYSSVGRNSVLLLNVPPDRRGLIHENDAKRLQELRVVLDATFERNLAAGAKVKASAVRQNSPRHSAGNIVDEDRDTYWTTDDWVTAATVEFDLGEVQRFNRAMLQEYIREGQRVESFVLEAYERQGWKEIARGTTIGYKRLLRFEDVTAQRLRLRITGSRVRPTLSNFGLYHQPPGERILNEAAPAQ